jgi:uncharacterized membrane protein
MELCILKFEDSHDAEVALKEVIDAQGDRNPWLHDVGMVARPLLGRVRIGATFPDGKSSTFHEGDLGDAFAGLGAYTGYFLSTLTGPLEGMFKTVNLSMAAGSLGSDAERRLLHLDEIKKALPRGSSALALVADTETCDQMVDLFESYQPQVIRRDVAEELRQRLEALHQTIAKGILQASAGSAPARQ